MADRSFFPQALLDDLSKLATNAAGVAQGAKDEVETLFRARLERWLQDQNWVLREEFDAVAEMARLAREENDQLAERLTALEEAINTRQSQNSDAS